MRPLSIALCAALLIVACKKDSKTKHRTDDNDLVGPEDEKKQPDPVPDPSPDDPGPRLLLLHEGRLFQASATGTASPVSVLDELSGSIVEIRFLGNGEGLLIGLQSAATNQRELWRVDVSPYRAQRVVPNAPSYLLDASGDGTILLSKDLEVIRVSGGDVEVTKIQRPDDDRVYRGVVSADGTRAAFSLRARDCRDEVAKCRVGLYGADLTATPIVAHPIVAGDRMTYDPQFVGDDEVMHMSNESDVSAACLEHAGQCRYDLVARQFDGSGGKQHVQSEAILGLYSPDRTKLGYKMVTNAAVAGSGVSWSRQSVFVKPLGGDAIRVAEANTANRGLLWSPDSRWIALVLADGPPKGAAVRIVRADGGAGRDVKQGNPAGWIAAPLPEGDETMPDPTMEGDDVLAVLRDHGQYIMGTPVALIDFSDAVVARASTYRPQPIGGGPGLDAWLSMRDRVLAVVDSDELCGLYERRNKVDYNVVAVSGDAYLVANELIAGETAIAPIRSQIVDIPPTDIGTRVDATFDATKQGGGIVDLIGIDMPSQVKRGEAFTMKLTWKVTRTPNRDWKVFVHFDGGGMRFQADHSAGLCSPMVLRRGDYLIDEFEVRAGDSGYPLGTYELYLGWFASVARAKVTAGTNDGQDRLRAGTLVLE
jgi:hypothetical protein